MYIVFLLLLLIMFIAISALGAIKEQKRKGVFITEKMQCTNYIQAIALLWGVTSAVFIMSYIGDISLAEIGFRPITFNYNTWFTAVTLALSGLAFVFFMYQLISSLAVAKSGERQVAGSQGALGMFPRTKKEKRLWFIVSLTAGTCEEIIYRGFLLFLLQAIFPNIPIILIILITFVLFGIGHLYQGLKGVIGTGVMGMLFMCLFLVTDSLIPVMLLHFTIDFSITFILTEKQV